MKAAHDKEVETLKNRVKEEQQKTEELKKELRECREIIASLEEEIDSVKESEGPGVTKTLERVIRGMLQLISENKHHVCMYM